MRTSLKGFLIAAALCSPTALFAGVLIQDQKPSISAGAQTSDIPVDEIVTKTVHEAWIASGRNEDKFFAMVQQCAELSAKNRDITLPDTAEAGERFGAWIKKEARKDPDQLLYVVVDRAVRYVGKTHTAAAAPAPVPAKD
ncbi:MAG: hypothetical protein P4K94_04825 [Terracidiphilus sp.]|nr:hypothetical protein [Terracidiphilus sp.]